MGSQGQLATARFHGQYFESAFVPTSLPQHPGMRSGNILTGAIPFQQSLEFGANMFGIPMPPSNRNVAPMFFVEPREFSANPGFQPPPLNAQMATEYLALGGRFPPTLFAVHPNQ
jgi:hypothetical protein